MSKVRADKLLVDTGIAATRARAQALILAGVVLANEHRVEKPSELLSLDCALRLKEEPLPYVSRGGLKLKGALDHFGVDVTGAVCLDMGASTGGFTDCLLQAGARKVYAVDVGYGQLAWSLRQNSNVVVIERTNIRNIAPHLIPDVVDVIVCDVSFISLTLVLPSGLQFARPGATLLALIKPQFEVGRALVGKGGIVKDEEAKQQAVKKICSFVEERGLKSIQVMSSPILGAKGNQEFLLFAKVA
jgi:23S rRNA (cytidine1920-2'-O)/16S rRNA (cytidine1409-2'-O)-methyltransferase